MQDAQLWKHHDEWIAYVQLEDGKNATMSLTQQPSDEEAERMNQLPIRERKALLLPLLKMPIALEEMLGEHL